MNLKNTYQSLKKLCSQNRTLRLACKTFLIIVCIALLAPFIANDKPLVCRYKNTWLFPAFSFKHQIILSNQEVVNYNMGKEWKLLESNFSIFPPCSYSPNTIDAENAPLKSPFSKQVITLKNNKVTSLPYKYRHWLGTTQNGNDVLSCMIHGTRVALAIGICSMLLAGLIGILLGACAGYYENTNLKMGFAQLLFLVLGSLIGWFYGFVVRSHAMEIAFNTGGLELFLTLFISIIITTVIVFIFNYLGKKTDILFKLKKTINFPIDTIISKTIEILNSIPSLLLIIALAAITKPSYTLLTVIIGFLSWTLIARTTRAEFLKAKRLAYVSSCKAIGMSDFRIMFKHILPNSLPVLFVQLVFGMASAVIIEASLSFIGVGVPIDTLTWGSLLNEGRDHFSSWWLVVLPGLCIFILVLVYNTISTQLFKNRQL
jgi:peptide/nickel transport system permease protein